MDLEPAPSRLSRLIQELTDREGEELQRALDASTALLAGLTRRGRGPTSRGDVATRARAERELELLFAAELARLCELAAEGESPVEPALEEGRRGRPAAGEARISVLARRALARRMESELDGAEDLDFLPAELCAGIRDLVRRLRRGERVGLALRWAATELRRTIGADRSAARRGELPRSRFPRP